MKILFKIIRWIIGVFFLLGGLGGLISGDYFMALIVIIVALFVIPISLRRGKKESRLQNELKQQDSIEPNIPARKQSRKNLTKIKREGNKTTITFDSDAILQSVIAKRQARQEEIDNYDYQYQTIRNWGLQLLESVHLLHTTKNFDTLKGRYDFIAQFYHDLCLAKHNKRFTADIQYSIDEYKSTYYNTMLEDFEIDLLYNPDKKKLKEFYLRSIGQCFKRFAHDQDLSIGSLKRKSAVQNRLNKIQEIADQSIREMDTFDQHRELGQSIVDEIKTTRDFIVNKYSASDSVPLPTTVDQIVVDAEASFPLTIYNTTKAKLKKVTSILYSDEYDKASKLMPLFAQHNIKCVEIEQYIDKYRPIYVQRIQNQKDSSPEYLHSSEMDQLDMTEEFKNSAIPQLYEIANCNLRSIFDYRDIPITVDDQLIKEYGYNNFALYMRLQNKVGKVITNWERKDIEDLGKTDLISLIDEIEVDEVLLTLPLKVLNAIAEKEEGHFKRKKKAVDYINEHGLSGNLGRHIATRRIFKVNPLPKRYENIDIDEVAKSWSYLKEYIRLFVNTYNDSKYHTASVSHTSRYIETWRVVPGYQDNCPRAKEECKKTYTRSNPPKLPFHVGCTCYLRSELKDY